MRRDAADVIIAIDQKALLRRRAGGRPAGSWQHRYRVVARGPVEMFAGRRQAQSFQVPRHPPVRLHQHAGAQMRPEAQVSREKSARRVPKAR